MSDMNESTPPELGQDIATEAAVFRQLVKHLQDNTDVQNIDLMNLASFCRNCLSKWYLAEAEKTGKNLTKDSVRTMVYGMDYEIWKEKYQK